MPSVLAPIATFTAAIVALLIALFGDQARSWLHPPRLKLALDRPLGKRMTVEGVSCRWFCGRVSNRKRSTKATEVHVLLLGVDSIEKTGRHEYWSGEVPMERSHAKVYPNPPVVGHDALYDLFTVYRDRRVALHPHPLAGDLRTEYGTPVHIALRLQVRATEADSETVEIEIDWDGQWAETDAELEKVLHVALRPAPDAAA